MFSAWDRKNQKNRKLKVKDQTLNGQSPEMKKRAKLVKVKEELKARAVVRGRTKRHRFPLEK